MLAVMPLIYCSAAAAATVAVDSAGASGAGSRCMSWCWLQPRTSEVNICPLPHTHCPSLTYRCKSNIWRVGISHTRRLIGLCLVKEVPVGAILGGDRHQGAHKEKRGSRGNPGRPAVPRAKGLGRGEGERERGRIREQERGEGAHAVHSHARQLAPRSPTDGP